MRGGMLQAYRFDILDPQRVCNTGHFVFTIFLDRVEYLIKGLHSLSSKSKGKTDGGNVEKIAAIVFFKNIFMIILP
jgi:hypothetical protein